jgi:hypothetical protein
MSIAFLIVETFGTYEKQVRLSSALPNSPDLIRLQAFEMQRIVLK